MKPCPANRPHRLKPKRTSASYRLKGRSCGSSLRSSYRTSSWQHLALPFRSPPHISHLVHLLTLHTSFTSSHFTPRRDWISKFNFNSGSFYPVRQLSAAFPVDKSGIFSTTTIGHVDCCHRCASHPSVSVSKTRK